MSYWAIQEPIIMSSGESSAGHEHLFIGSKWTNLETLKGTVPRKINQADFEQHFMVPNFLNVNLPESVPLKLSVNFKR